MTDWSRLTAAARANPPTLWWRDDDAVAHTPALDRLLALAKTVDAPLTLAVIPAHASDSLASAIEDRPVTVATHGHSHENHAPPTEKKAEFGAHRPRATLQAAAAEGRDTLAALFGAQALPLFIPPWNRFAPDLPHALRAAGYTALSAYGQRSPTHDPILRIDAHIDPIDWRGTRSAIDTHALITHVIALLETDAPIGLMTHHLAHDEAIWTLTEALIRTLTEAGGRWVSARHLMTGHPF